MTARMRGFTLIELIVLMGFITTISAICIAWIPRLTEVMEADADLAILRGQITFARETATTERRSIEIQFVAPNVVQVVRQDLPNGTTVLSRAFLEHNAQYLQFAGEPDTPDRFGNGGAINLGGAARVFFTPDGTLADAAGNPTNVSLFIEQPSRVMTARALTIFGPTARIRGYRWNGSAWRQ